MRITFTLNGTSTEFESPPDRRVVDLIREDLHLTGTKESCGSGECGACTILVDGTPRLACLMLAAQLQGRRITTIEGIAPDGAYHPVQQMFVEQGAVQCGFCSPGMVLSSVALLEQNPHPSREEIRQGVSGNLCRCTGYTKIVDAVQAAAMLPPYPVKPVAEDHALTPDVPQGRPGAPADLTPGHLPRSLAELWTMLDDDPESAVYAGGTDLIVKMRQGLTNPRRLVCLERVKELAEVTDHGDSLCIGAGTTHSQLLGAPLIREHLPVLVQAVRGLGSPLIRNMGTIGGNICTASPGGDTLPPLYVLEAQVELRTKDAVRRMPLCDFIVGPGATRLGEREVLTAVWVAKPTRFNFHHFEKVGQRNALACALASLAALLRVSPEGIVEDAALAWGSVAPAVIRSRAVEQALIGKPLSFERLRSAAALARTIVTPIDDLRGSADYRRKIAGNLILRLIDAEGTR
jgi:xanthine dehydrogenase small subunit